MPAHRLPSAFPAFSAFLALAALPLASCGKSAEAPAAPQAMPPLPVHLAAATPVDVPVVIETIGRAEGAREVEVRARVQGILEKRLYDEGQAVKAGQALFAIERAPYEVALAEAKALLAQAAAQSEQAAAQRAQAEAAQARAKSDLAQAARDFARLKALLADKAVSQREVDAAEAAEQAADAGVKAAQAGLASAEAAKASAEAAKAAAEAKIKDAQLNLSYCLVTAPVDGVSGRAVKSEGALVSPADGLLTTLAQTDPIWVRFSWSNADLAKVEGDPVKAVEKVSAFLPSGAEYGAPGKINFSGSTVDPQLDTLTLRAEFPNKERAVLPGQFLRVKAQVGVKKGVFLLPQEAVMTDPRIGQGVFILGADGTAQLRPVKAGAWQGDRWIIEPGEGTALKAGDRVIVDQLSKIGFMMMKTGGKPVSVVDAATLGAPGKPESKADGKPEIKPSDKAGVDTRAPGSKEGAAK